MFRTARIALVFSTLVVALIALPLSTAFAAAPSKDEVVATIKKAIAFYKASGREKALAEFNNKDGQFAKGEAYVDVHDVSGVCVAHPTTPAIVGKNRLDQADPNGKFFIREIVETAKKQSSGWINYVRKNPTNGSMQNKTAYWEVYDGLIFKAGTYAE
jgi:signal transduction histidine kinase